MKSRGVAVFVALLLAFPSFAEKQDCPSTLRKAVIVGLTLAAGYASYHYATQVFPPKPEPIPEVIEGALPPDEPTVDGLPPPEAERIPETWPRHLPDFD